VATVQGPGRLSSRIRDGRLPPTRLAYGLGQRFELGGLDELQRLRRKAQSNYRMCLAVGNAAPDRSLGAAADALVSVETPVPKR
jgi:hypothetical protein